MLDIMKNLFGGNTKRRVIPVGTRGFKRPTLCPIFTTLRLNIQELLPSLANFNGGIERLTTTTTNIPLTMTAYMDSVNPALPYASKAQFV